MLFIYKTKDGRTGMVKDVDSLPSDIRKLIVRRYNGSVFALPYVDELTLDCNRGGIHDIKFKCDKLSIYKPDIYWLNINHTPAGHDSQFHSTFNTLVRLKLERVEDAYCMLQNTLCTNIIPELDFTDMSRCYNGFRNTNIYNIPHNIKISTSAKYVDFYKGSKIPQHKLLAIDKLLTISEKVKTS